MEGERESLSQQNVALRGEVESLRRANARVLAYEETIKRRLQVLSTTIESATSLGLFDSDEHSAHGGFGSLGGAEVECMGHVGCAASLLRGEQISQSALGALVTRDVLEKQGQEVVAALDFYSDLLSAIPIGTPGNGHISSPYGMRRSPFTRRWTMHQGIDI